MYVCSHCEGFIPLELEICPNCEASIQPSKKKRRVSKILNGLAAGSVAMTLMACYGQPPPPPSCQDLCRPKSELLTDCKKKCREEKKKSDLLWLYFLNEQEKAKRQNEKQNTILKNISKDNDFESMKDFSEEP